MVVHILIWIFWFLEIVFFHILYVIIFDLSLHLFQSFLFYIACWFCWFVRMSKSWFINLLYIYTYFMNICILGREHLKYVHVVLPNFRTQVTAKKTRLWRALLSLIYLLCTVVTETTTGHPGRQFVCGHNFSSVLEIYSKRTWRYRHLTTFFLNVILVLSATMNSVGKGLIHE